MYAQIDAAAVTDIVVAVVIMDMEARVDEEVALMLQGLLWE